VEVETGPSGRRRRWVRPVLVGALAVVVGGGGLLAALPGLLRWAIARQLTGLTGEPVRVADVDLNLFTRRLAIVGVRLGADHEPALVGLERLDAEFRLLPLLRGHLHLDRARLVGAAVHVLRRGDGTLNVAGILERLRARPPAERGLAFTLVEGRVEAGAVVFEDRALTPPRTWQAAGITADLRSLSTAADRPPGSAHAAFTLAGAPVEVAAEGIRLHPAGGRARIVLSGLDVSQAAAYLRDAAVRPVSGRFGGTWNVQYGEAGFEGGGRARLETLALGRGEADAPVVTVPAVTMTSHDVTYRDGVLTLGRFEISGEPTILVPASGEPRRSTVRNFHVLLTGLSYPAGRPGRLTVSGDLPAGGRLTAEGSVRLEPIEADLLVRLSSVDLGLVVPYLPPQTPVTIERGTLAASLQVRYHPDRPARVDGDVALRDFVLRRRGQSEPFVTHPELRFTITGLEAAAGALTLEALTMAGSPTLVDASVKPPQRFHVPALSLTVQHASWPSRGPATVRGEARLARGRARLQGHVDPATLAVDVRLVTSGVDLSRLSGYLPPGAEARLDRGRLDASLRLRHDRRSGVVLSGHGVVGDLVLTGAGSLRVEDPGLAFQLQDVRFHEGRLAAAALTAHGAPALVLDQSAGVERRLDVPGLGIELQDVSWPPKRPARFRIAADLPDRGRLTADGWVDLARSALAGSVEIADAELAPYRPFVPISAPLRGRLDGRLALRAELGAVIRVHATGNLTAQEVALGDPERPPVAVRAIEIASLEARWPERVEAEQIVITAPKVFIEREADGDFPLLAALRPPAVEDGGVPPSASPGPAAGSVGAPAGPAFAVREVRLEDGDLRFLDRTTRPFYSEELRRLSLTMTGLDSGAGRANLAIQGVIGTDAALELRGVVAPFGRPFFLEVEGELRRFAVPRTNPYLARFLDWIARSGELTTRLHYRVVGEELRGTNEILVERLRVERPPGEVGRALGLPLALIVSLLKNPRGDIHLTVPVEGQIGSPRFSFGDAIATALRNVVTGLVAGPLRAIGRVFTGREGVPADVEIEPATFAAGSAALTPEAARHLQRVADVLRSSPFVRLSFRVAVTETDRLALARQAVVGAVQQAQREGGLADFAAAARRVFALRAPGRPVPERTEAIIEALAAEATVPDSTVGDLAARREEAVRGFLIEEAGLEPERLVSQAPTTAAAGTPRVEFELMPAG
jgi:hypothetical protein